MSNVLDHEKQQQILALGRLGWTVNRIAEATAVRRETAARYLRAAGLAVRGRGRPSEAPAKGAIVSEVSPTPQNRQFPDCRCFRRFLGPPLDTGSGPRC
jgi:hypothetical protein